MIPTRSKACVINTHYMQICHRHKGTAVHGLTFLFVTSKHTGHPRWHGTSLISLHLFPTLHQIPRWIWMFFISAHPSCLHRWHKHHFSYEDLDLSADLTVVDRLKYRMVIYQSATVLLQKLGSVTLLPSQTSSCLLSLILMAEEPRGTTQNWRFNGLIHVCGWLLDMQELKSGPNGIWGVHE